MAKKDKSLQEVFSGTVSIVPSVKISRKDLSKIRSESKPIKRLKSNSKKPINLSLFFSPSKK